MESTSGSSHSSVESTARTRFTRGISLKACVAKAAGWTLEKAKDVTLPEIKECKTTSCVYSKGRLSYQEMSSTCHHNYSTWARTKSKGGVLLVTPVGRP